MTTVINSPGTGESTGVGMIVGVLLAIFAIALFFMYGWPAIRANEAGDSGSIDVNLKLPEGGEGSGDGPSSEY